ncbi:MAG TPA: 2-dehydropantoate 2-reductase [Stellaceae bacterium]|jgi:2-dehydropantoate 2-reductase|nr:2-dehydropantoate 2-reductase [Stellaceae bacterium]
MRILVLGAGAVGGYFGGRLAEAKADVTFLVRPQRAAALNARGLVIESPMGNLRLPVQVATADTLAGDFATVLLTAKAYDLEQAIAAIRPAVGPETAILPVLNGLGHLDRLDEAFGRERILGGVAYIAATLTADGAIRHLNRVHGITFGERSGGTSDRVAAIGRVFAPAVVSAPASTDIMRDMWEKFIMISSLAGMNCLMRGSVGEIMSADDGEGLMLELVSECEAVATASGYPPRPDQREQYRAMLTDRGSGFSASMQRDLEAGERTEGDQILGDMLWRARALGIPAPLLRLAVCHLQVHERRLAARR